MTSWDKEVTGLHTITRGGRSSYYLYYRTKIGRQRRSKLGDLKVLSLSQAREQARKILAEVTLGRDPFGEMRIARGEHTIGEIYTELLKEHYSKPRFQKSRWGKEITYLWANHLERAFTYRKVSAVKAPDIREWHIRYEVNVYAGNRAKALLSKIFSYAEMKGYIPAGSNPCRPVPNHTERKRERFASFAEMQRLGSILRREAPEHPREVLFIHLLIFTGSRPSAIERSTWNDLDLISHEGQTYGVLRVQGKTGQDVIGIPPFVVEDMKKLRGGATLTGIKFPRAFWERIREEAGCHDLWARDWRRTFATIALSTGVSLGGVGELLNQKDPKVTVRYAKLLLESRLKWSKEVSHELCERMQ